ncbi:thermostable hemolysin [Pseudoalteromonas denitrificans]|uniref:Thermostable hemolysin n=1 Tax=Pseudoalteromonas denitrificans DSM 6059 TaxID=1123010 RepID=A0A1I1FDP1_9GAMM|nr:thermostable hemolysin [Pseudoalteromonas denitrificans]SFB97082.1 Thermostable hemolysin [Pseudoalteromonas denitrificans DSM 6059]
MNQMNISNMQNRNKVHMSAKQRRVNLNMCFDDNSELRAQLQSFITEGFEKAFDAHVSSFLPLLIQLGDSKPRATLGLRSARSALFIEQYLNAPIEKLILSSKPVLRNEIAELGNLYSSNRRFTVPLFMTMAVSLFLADFKYLTFSGTDQVRTLLTKLDVSFVELKDAKQDALKEGMNDWGDYYLHAPKICVLKLSNIMALINSKPEHQKQMAELAFEISALTKELKKL